jgi:hypothetical protein
MAIHMGGMKYFIPASQSSRSTCGSGVRGACRGLPNHKLICMAIHMGAMKYFIPASQSSRSTCGSGVRGDGAWAPRDEKLICMAMHIALGRGHGTHACGPTRWLPGWPRTAFMGDRPEVHKCMAMHLAAICMAMHLARRKGHEPLPITCPLTGAQSEHAPGRTSPPGHPPAPGSGGHCHPRPSDGQ